MTLLPDPVWPVLVLAVVSFGDGLMCIRPLPFIAKCFEDVRWPRRYWWVMPPIKFAAALGLVTGIWIPVLGLVTNIALVAYFVIAIGMHVRARDFGRTLFLNATGMLLFCIGVLVYSFLV
jgi:DoxX-like family